MEGSKMLRQDVIGGKYLRRLLLVEISVMETQDFWPPCHPFVGGREALGLIY